MNRARRLTTVMVALICTVWLLPHSSALQTASITLASGERLTRSAVVDPDGNYAYFGMGTFPARVVKVDLDDFTRSAVVTLSSYSARVLLMDPGGLYLYVGTQDEPGRVVKIDLSTFTVVGSLTLNTGEDDLTSGVIEPDGSHAYFGTHQDPGKIVKVDLATMAREQVITAPGSLLTSAVIHPSQERAYFGSFSGTISEVDLATFAVTAQITPGSPRHHFYGAAVDPSGDHAYFATYTRPPILLKIDLDPFEHVDEAVLSDESHGARGVTITPAGDFAYLAISSTEGRVAEIDLADLSVVGAVQFPNAEGDPFAMAVDPDANHAYFGTSNDPARVVKVGPLIKHKLTVAPTGSGSGSVSSGSIIFCEYDGTATSGMCERKLAEGSNVTLSATPDASSVFAGWSGEGCADVGTCQVSLSAARDVGATFTARPDARIQRSSDGDVFVGADLYAPTDQTSNWRVARGKKRTFNVVVANQSPTEQSYSIHASCRGKGFAFSSIARPDAFLAPFDTQLDPGESLAFDLTIKAGKKPKGTALCDISATSTVLTSAFDRVVASVKAS